jgi:hypothetical protein
MDLTGYEALVFFVFLGPLLVSPWAGALRAGRHPALYLMAAAGLAGASYVQSLVVRTFLLAPATGLCALATAARWSKTYPWLGWGAVLVMLDRLHGFSRSSIWSVPGCSWLLFAATLVAVLLVWRDEWPYNERSQDDNEPSPNNFLIAVSLGSVLFLFHWFALQVCRHNTTPKLAVHTHTEAALDTGVRAAALARSCCDAHVADRRSWLCARPCMSFVSPSPCAPVLVACGAAVVRGVDAVIANTVERVFLCHKRRVSVVAGGASVFSQERRPCAAGVLRALPGLDLDSCV